MNRGCILLATLTVAGCSSRPQATAPGPTQGAAAELAPSLRSYLSPEVLATLDQPDDSCSAAVDAYTHGANQALEGNAYLQTHHLATDQPALACERFPADPDRDCCMRGFGAGIAAMSPLFERWSETDFEPGDGGHTDAQVDVIEGCVSDASRGSQFALVLCGGGQTEPPHCPTLEPALAATDGHLGCWSIGFNQRFATCSPGPYFQQLLATLPDCDSLRVTIAR